MRASRDGAHNIGMSHHPLCNFVILANGHRNLLESWNFLRVSSLFPFATVHYTGPDKKECMELSDIF